MRLPQTNNSWQFNVTNSVCFATRFNIFICRRFLHCVCSISHVLTLGSAFDHFFSLPFFYVWLSHASLILLCVGDVGVFLKILNSIFSALWTEHIFVWSNKTADDPTVEMCIICCLTIHISLFLFPLHAFAISNILYSVQRIMFLRFPATRLSSEKKK